MQLLRQGVSLDAQFLQNCANLVKIVGIWIAVPVGQRGKWCKSC